MEMKRLILSIAAALVVVAGSARVRPRSSVTMSTTLGAGLTMGAEWAFAGQASVVARAGMISRYWSLTNSFGSFQWSASMVPGVTVEPRYYLLMNWRKQHGKYTYGNSAEFIGVPVTVTLDKTGKYMGEFAVTPVLGIRRAFAKHWFHEFTAGAELLFYPARVVSPHVGYRFGILF